MQFGDTYGRSSSDILAPRSFVDLTGSTMQDQILEYFTQRLVRFVLALLFQNGFASAARRFQNGFASAVRR